MAGLLGGLNFNDPNIALAAGLLSGRGNLGANLSLGLLGAAQAAQAQKEQQSRSLRDQLVQMQAEAMKRAQEQQAAMDAAAKKNVIPGQPQMLPTDQELPSGPAGPSTFNLPGFLNDYTSIDPIAAMKFRAQMAQLNQKPFAQINPKDFTAESVAAFMRTGNYADLKPLTKATFTDQGNAIVPRDPYTGLPVGAPIPKTMTPGEVAGNRIAQGNLDVNRGRLGIEGQNLFYNTGMRPGGLPPMVRPSPGVPAGPLAGGQPQVAPATGVPGMSPKDASRVAATLATKRGENQITAQQQLPDLEAQTQQTIDLVDKMLSHPGFSTVVGAKGATGIPAAAGYPIPGTDAADFVTLQRQLLGKQFMQAYATLKGGGQITEVEGKKATDAIAAMQNAQSENAFREGAEQFKSVLRGALERMRNKAGGGVPASAGNSDPLGIR